MFELVNKKIPIKNLKFCFLPKNYQIEKNSEKFYYIFLTGGLMKIMTKINL